MEFNKHIRAVGFVVFGFVASFQVNAYTGGVTTYRNSPTTPGNIERAYTSPAKAGVEHDATYQRTMRNAQTGAAAARAARGILKTISGIGLLITVVQLAGDLQGIWKKDVNGDNMLLVPPKGACTVEPCYSYIPSEGTRISYTTPEAACRALVETRRAIYGNRFEYAGVNATGTQCLMNDVMYGGAYGAGIEKVSAPPIVNPPLGKIADQDFEDYLKTWPMFPKLLEEMDKANSPITFPGDDVEDMPTPIVLLPRVTVHPDGSKTISKTELTPYRSPDGKTINWERKVTTTEESPPDAQGNTVKRDTVTTDNSKSSEAPPNDKPECEKSPDTLGCIKMDTPDGEIPKTTKDVSYVAETLFGSATCPVSRVISQSLTGHPIYLHFTPTCDALATFVKPMVIAIALFMAYLIILPGNRE